MIIWRAILILGSFGVLCLAVAALLGFYHPPPELIAYGALFAVSHGLLPSKSP